jgi:hypothetical protein
MEEARSVLDYLAIGMLGFVLLAMIALLFRTLTLVLGFLSLPIADSLERLALWRRRRGKPLPEPEKR